MGAVGAMAPTNFQKDAFGTHEISNSMYINNTLRLVPIKFLFTLEWHPPSQIPKAK